MGQTTVTTDAKRVNVGEDCTLRGDLRDEAEPPQVLIKSALKTFTLTLVNEADGETINSRSAVDVLDTAGGYVDTDGTYRVKLGPLDNAKQGTEITEFHIAQLAWTWDDSDGDERIGMHNYRIELIDLP